MMMISEQAFNTPIKFNTDQTFPSISSPNNGVKPSERKKSTSGTAKKRQIEQIEVSMNDMIRKLDRMKKVKRRLEKTVAEEEIKKREKDLILSSNSSLGIAFIHPQPFYNYKISQDYFFDVLSSWQYLHIFRSKLCLPQLTLESFIDLIVFVNRDSVGLVEVFSALLKLLLRDKSCVNKIMASIPKQLSFEHRSMSSNTSTSVESTDDRTILNRDEISEIDYYNISRKIFDWCQWSIPDSIFDCGYNGLSLLPRRLSVDTINPISWSAALRCIILRLEPVKQMRKQITMRMSDTAVRSGSTLGKSSSTTPLKEYITSSNNSFTSPYISSSSNSQPTTINTMKPNKDSYLSITSDATLRLCYLHDACLALETTELYALKPQHKLALLSTLIEACNGTAEITKHMETNAEELSNKIAEMSKNLRDSKLSQKVATESRRQDAIQACKDALTLEFNRRKSSSGKSKDKSKENDGKNEPKIEPTPQQIANMLEDLVMLSTYEIDGLGELPPLPLPSEDLVMNLDDYDYTDVVALSSTRLKNLKKKDRNYEAAKAWEEYDSKKELQKEAMEALKNAISSGAEKDLRQAIKKGIRAQMKWTNSAGKRLCTYEIKDAYKLLHQIDQKAKEDKEAANYEKALVQYCNRVEPLGKDRYECTYWMFPGCEDKLFVQRPDPVKSQQIIQSCRRIENTLTARHIFTESSAIQVLYNCRPTLKAAARWGCYDTGLTLRALCDSLDVQIESEKILKAAITANYDVSEDSSPFITEGSEYIGRKVNRAFGRKTVIGEIIGWWPAEGNDPALWHVRHLDGDEEDLEEHEIKACLIPLQSSENDKEGCDSNPKLLNECDDINKNIKKSFENIVDESDEENGIDVSGETEVEEPSIITNFPLYKRNYIQIKDSSIGLSGLQQELLCIQKSLIESMKRISSDYSKSVRKAWKENVRNAFSLEELRDALLELEESIHKQQVEDDVQDEVEYARNHKQKVKQMLKEGWVFEPGGTGPAEEQGPFDPTGPTDVIGRRARRFFPGYGRSDGVIVAYLPPERNEGLALWHMEHDDGDAEDLEESDVEKVVRHFAQDAQEDDARAGDEESTEAGDAGDDDSEEDTEHAARGRLWPTAGVRDKWRSSVSRSRTGGEVALALMALTRHATRLGLLEDGEPIERPQGDRRRGKNELQGLLRGADLSVLAADGTRSSARRRKEARRKSFFYS